MANDSFTDTKAWEALHQQWWNAISDGANRWVSGDWRDNTRVFNELFGGKLGQNVDAASERFVSGTKQYLDWVEKLSAQLAGGTSFPSNAAEWSRLFQGAMGPMGEMKNPLHDLFATMTSDGARGFESFAQGLPNPFDLLKGEMLGALAMPTFGYTRESQQRHQRLAAAAMQYQDAMGQYNRLMLDASKGALKKLEVLLAKREQSGRKLETLREVYDLWIDAAEEAYAEVSLSPEFRAAYGDLVNKQMAVRQLVQIEVERLTSQFGMPTRTEVDSTARRMQEMRREMRAMQERLEALEGIASAPVPVENREPVEAPAKKSPAATKKSSVASKPSAEPAKKAPARRSRQ